MKTLVIYVVKPGDNLYSIARRFGVAVEQIVNDNDIADPAIIVVGQALVIQGNFQTYTVKPGDSIWGIASQFGISMQEIMQSNPQITDPAALAPGMKLIIPVPTQQIGRIEVNGYAFAGGNTAIVEQSLPYLTYLSIFSYSAKPDGSLSEISDEQLLNLAKANRIAPMMVITNTGPKGGFDSDVAHAILNDPAVQQVLINNVVGVLQAKGYAGLNIDFEYVYPEDRENYNAFLEKITARLHELNYIISTSLAPKTSATQQGLLYEAHDYPFHGKTVDRVILMTYEWGYTYGAPQAVAPINAVRGVLDYAVTVIPPAKIMMGVPNYGYDWPLPYVEGQTAAQAIGNSAAVQIAAQYKAEIKYDRQAQTPFFNYVDENNVFHVVWFEDARSMLAKFLLANEEQLAGISYWTLGNRFTQNWVLLNDMFRIKKVR